MSALRNNRIPCVPSACATSCTRSAASGRVKSIPPISAPHAGDSRRMDRVTVTPPANMDILSSIIPASRGLRQPTGTAVSPPITGGVMNYAGIAAGIGCACAALVAQAAENFPVRPVRMIVAFTAGSETDFFARVVAQKMADHWNQQVVVDNRPGAGGVLATRLVAAASPNGYTIF